MSQMSQERVRGGRSWHTSHVKVKAFSPDRHIHVCHMHNRTMWHHGKREVNGVQ